MLGVHVCQLKLAFESHPDFKKINANSNTDTALQIPTNK